MHEHANHAAPAAHLIDLGLAVLQEEQHGRGGPTGHASRSRRERLRERPEGFQQHAGKQAGVAARSVSKADRRQRSPPALPHLEAVCLIANDQLELLAIHQRLVEPEDIVCGWVAGREEGSGVTGWGSWRTA